VLSRPLEGGFFCDIKIHFLIDKSHVYHYFYCEGYFDMMKKEHISTSLFFLIAAVFFFLFYKIIIPFFAPICWAAVFAIIFYPLYEKLLTKLKSKGWTSFIICMLIIILIIGPITYLLAALASEAVTGA
jgi:predicted PurR-regulated permease PerM